MSSAIQYFASAAIIIMCCLTSCNRNNSQSKSQVQHPTTEIATQKIAISTESLKQGLCDTLRFGAMHAGEIVSKKIALTNTDNQPMVLLRHVTSCGCTTIEYERKPINPNGTMMLSFEYDSRAQSGWQMKLMELYFADSDSPLKIYLEAEVE